MEMTPDSSDRRGGRPPKTEGPRLPTDEVDRLLVHGETVTHESGYTQVVYPSFRELARRFDCAHSLIAKYATDHNCMRRRNEVRSRLDAKIEAQLIELRADAIAVSRDDAVKIIDSYLLGFRDAVAEGRVRFDSPADFNAMLRLKAFVLGGADSRQELHVGLSLEDLQARHQRMLRACEGSTAAERGEIVDAELLPDEGDEPLSLPSAPPDGAPAEDLEKLSVQFSGVHHRGGEGPAPTSAGATSPPGRGPDGTRSAPSPLRSPRPPLGAVADSDDEEGNAW